MQYIIVCYDKPDMLAVRKQHVEEHRAYFRDHPMKILAAGPLCLSDTADDDVGSFILVEADTIDDVRAFQNGDPFTAAGVFADVRINRFINKRA